MTTAYTSTLVLMNACLIVSMAAVALWQWSAGAYRIGRSPRRFRWPGS